MKQLTILSGKALVVELPEEVTNPRIWPESPDRLYVDDPLGYNGVDQIDLPSGNWRIIGMLSEVREDDLINIIDVLVSSKSGKCLFPNFTGGPWKTNRIESLESAIEAEGYYLDVNPLGKEKKYRKSYTGHDMFFADHMVKYYDAQSRVLCREMTLILRRVDG